MAKGAIRTSDKLGILTPRNILTCYTPSKRCTSKFQGDQTIWHAYSKLLLYNFLTGIRILPTIFNVEIGTTRPTQVYHYEYILDVINCKSPESEAMEMTLIHVECNSMGIQLGIRHTDGMYIIFIWNTFGKLRKTGESVVKCLILHYLP